MKGQQIMRHCKGVFFIIHLSKIDSLYLIMQIAVEKEDMVG
jgi:hypothetical protein